MFCFIDFALLYTVLSFLFLGGLLGWLLFLPNKQHPWFVPAALLVLVFLRLPSVFINQEFNPDESQMITQALTLGSADPVYLRAVDTTTGGPLNSYLLVLPALLGLPYDYVTARLVACLLILVSLWFFYKTALLWADEQAARLALLPWILVLGFTQNTNYLHYSSELIAVMLLSLSGYLYARQTTYPRLSGLSLFMTGLALGMVPFAKLQGVPPAALIGLCVALNVWLRPGLVVNQRVSYGLMLVAGGLLFPALFLGMVASTGKMADFMTFYIDGNLSYGTGGNLLQRAQSSLKSFNQYDDQFGWVIILAGGSVLLPLARLMAGQRIKPSVRLSPIVFVVALMLASLYAVVRPGTGFPHYMLFLIGPLLLSLAISWSWLPASKTLRTALPVALMSFLLVSKAVPLMGNILTNQPIALFSAHAPAGWQLTPSSVVKRIGLYAQPGELLAVWGWHIDYYVEAQMPQGVAENHTIRSIADGQMRSVYQARYVQDLKRTRPPVFVDAVGLTNQFMNDRATQAHEIYTPLRVYIDTHYQLTDTINNNRIYVRRDRLASLKTNSMLGLKQPKRPNPASWWLNVAKVVSYGSVLTANPVIRSGRL